MERGARQPSGSCFVSDLHLFARRSEGQLWEPAIHRAVRESHTFVLGGDIFDFRWRTQSTIEASVRDSIRWLERLTEINPDCRLVYLLGNHDSQPRFVAALDQLAARHPLVSWHRHLLRIGDRVFLHGDVVDQRIAPDQCHHRSLDARREWSDQRPDPAAVSHALYEAVVRTRLHRVAVRLATRKRRVLGRLASYLDRAGAGLAEGVTDVFFGHIHRPLDGVEWRGRRFHNPGAAIRGLPFRIVDAGLKAPPSPAAAPAVSHSPDSVAVPGSGAGGGRHGLDS